MGIRERKLREFRRREREILAAARDLFSRDDWQTVTVEQIAERAEIGKGTVYKHFTSKDEIYAALAVEYQKASVKKLESLDATQPVMQRLRRIIELIWDERRRGGVKRRLVQHCERSDFRRCLPAERQAELEALDERLKGAIDRVLQDGIDQGILPDKSPDALVFGPMAALQGAVSNPWLVQASESEQRAYLTELMNFILAGMLYQEWLAEEGLDEGETKRRAEVELEEAAADLDGDVAAASAMEE
jgi:AcrR family transcriptional regulator